MSCMERFLCCLVRFVENFGLAFEENRSKRNIIINDMNLVMPRIILRIFAGKKIKNIFRA